ncbi:MAG: MBOAT family protein [Oscillospiraceae bacterium]|nr:MBOAT family protein [Oscillospiraceae bacterium]
MLFNSVPFMIFLPIAAFLYYIVPQKLQRVYLLAVSYYVYACFDLRAVPFIVVATLSSFFAAKAIDSKTGKARKNALIACVVINVGLLCVFKYLNFFASSVVAVANMFGANVQFGGFSLIAVTGISFFTFQSVGYVADVYWGKIKAEKNLLNYSLFIAFFPHVLAGPISRGGSLLPQMQQPHSFDYSGVKNGLQLMAIGFFKKIAVADVLAMFIGAVFNDLESYSALMLIFTACAYSIQLYADFSGYSDIARGCAKVLGFDIVDNFSTPFLSTSFKEFWNRWHISLSSWFGSYVYIPLGGNRKGEMRKYINIAIIFLLSGLWHGSAWTFIIWGALHAIYRVGEEVLRKFSKNPTEKPTGIKYWFKVAVVFGLFTFSMIFFRANTVGDAFYYVTHLVGNFSPSVFMDDVFRAVGHGFDFTPILIYGYIAYCMLVVAITVGMDLYRYFALKGQCLTNAFATMKWPVRYICYYALVALIMAGFIMQNGGYGASASFIYANF